MSADARDRPPARRATIPIVAVESAAATACEAAEPFALLVLGDAMAPEFADGDVIVVEPEGLAADGAYVVAQAGGEWMLRQLARSAEGWMLRTPDGREPPIAIADLACVRGVVIQKTRPGRRRSTVRYGPGAAPTPMGYPRAQRSD